VIFHRVHEVKAWGFHWRPSRSPARSFPTRAPATEKTLVASARPSGIRIASKSKFGGRPPVNQPKNSKVATRLWGAFDRNRPLTVNDLTRVSLRNLPKSASNCGSRASWANVTVNNHFQSCPSLQPAKANATETLPLVRALPIVNYRFLVVPRNAQVAKIILA
jgi:hypothetical protein